MRALILAILSAIERRIMPFKAFGSGSVIRPLPRTMRGIKYVSIGRDCFFGDGLILVASDSYAEGRYTPELIIGDRCTFGADALIGCTHGIYIGNDVVTSARCFIADSYHGYSDPTRPIVRQPMEGGAKIYIGDGCFIGIGAAIMPGVTLGKNCTVGANAVVTQSFGDYSVIAGVPARLLKRFDTEKQAWVEGER